MAHSPVSDSTSYSRRKREILKNQNAKKYTYDDDFDSDDASRRRSRTISRARSRSYSPVDEKKQTKTEPQRRRSYSLTPSPSLSRSNSRNRYKNQDTDHNYKTRKISKNSFSPSNLTPESSIKLKNNSKDTFKTKNSSYDLKTKSIPNGKVSQRSSESCPAPNQRVYQQKIKKLQKNLNANQSKTPVNQSVARVISAQRVKNNDLQNRIAEVTIELNKLREENKLLKKLHQREEKELKKLETQDVDVTRVIKNFTDEINSLKNNLRQAKNDNSRLNNMVNDRDEELRVLKKRYSELKDILNDKKLLDSAELSKKLDKCERELEDYKEKNQVSFK
jgi:chromosome segregation ATPase